MSTFFVELEHFTAEEIEEYGPLDPELLVKLQAMRYLVDGPIYLTSGLRVSGAHADHDHDGDSEAVDISDNPRSEPISSRWRFKVEEAAYRVGLRRKGSYDKHIHIDVREDRDQDVAWIGESQ